MFLTIQLPPLLSVHDPYWATCLVHWLFFPSLHPLPLPNGSGKAQAGQFDCCLSCPLLTPLSGPLSPAALLTQAEQSEVCCQGQLSLSLADLTLPLLLLSGALCSLCLPSGLWSWAAVYFQGPKFVSPIGKWAGRRKTSSCLWSTYYMLGTDSSSLTWQGNMLSSKHEEVCEDDMSTCR